ncbi:MAG: 2-C-methyl-D-erythritol 2,4-cyclodiphosphate synthase [Oscillospiraceae bacterium]
MKPTVLAVIAAAGSSERAGTDKLEVVLPGGETVLERSVRAVSDSPLVDDVVIVTRADKVPALREKFSGHGKVRTVAAGGSTRSESVVLGIKAGPEDDFVCIHDAARPFASRELIDRVISAAFESGAAAPCLPLKDTVKFVSGDEITGTPDRNSMRAVGTPQVFRRDLYMKAAEMSSGTFDDCQVMENAGYRVKCVDGEEANVKITTMEDIRKAVMDLRTGFGYDVHRLVPGRKLILGGVEIPYEKGLLGHSDADAALHALMDAVLGAAGLPDIGHLFPDTDPRYEGADSLELLRETVKMAAEKGYTLGNADVTIVCQKPKLAPYIDEMRERTASACGAGKDQVNFKATTEEGLGFTGTGEGIAAYASVILKGC